MTQDQLLAEWQRLNRKCSDIWVEDNCTPEKQSIRYISMRKSADLCKARWYEARDKAKTS